jgi:alkylation response protein AidB-like acyl-CoA dehydrogenase
LGGPIDTDQLARWRALAQATLAADLLGSLVAAHDMTLVYAGDRQQYGRAIGSFQAVQHLMADSLVWLEGARSAVQYATWSADQADLTEVIESALVAKIYTSIAARSVCEIAIQVHGGIGNTWECMVHVHLRRALVSAQALGSENLLLEELARRRQGSPVGLPR